jgi:hypothetical protein
MQNRMNTRFLPAAQTELDEAIRTNLWTTSWISRPAFISRGLAHSAL